MPGSGRPIEPSFGAPVERVAGGHRRGLAQAVALDKLAAGSASKPRFTSIGSAGAAGDAEFERGEIEIADARVPHASH